MPRTFEKVLKDNSRTFHAASKLLPRQVRNDVLKIYSFCRLYDDNADLDRHDDTKELEEYIQKLGIDSNVINELKSGIDSDRNYSGMKNISELLKYSYKVAGCVGLMICDVMAIKNEVAKYHAIDLGIAMQLTNICRDVLVDYRDGRVYLPDDMTRGIDISEIDDEDLLEIISNLIIYADQYYESAVNGLRFVPISSRFSILYALRLYQAIGHNILKGGNKFFEKKINTSRIDKLLILIKSFIEFIVMFFPRLKNHKHKKNLHQSLQGLPYVDEKF
tara:strand:+ start:2101 stop:2928 length:828 start_codon:yes stop_codon:yes gene_type:complete